MAEALAKKMFGNNIFIDSVGIHDDLGKINPFTVSVMAEIGIDVSKHHPKNFETLNDSSFDLVITLSPEAHHRALDLTRFYSTDVEYWPTMDPTKERGSRENIIAAFRSVRDYLEGKIRERLAI
jgi:protein-tyrosine-phosphatase